MKVEPPSIEDAIDILKGLRPRYEDHHKMELTDAAVTAAVSFPTATSQDVSSRTRRSTSWTRLAACAHQNHDPAPEVKKPRAGDRGNTH
ncbi:MAG: hypothetical protein Ct9H300mP32_2570 [Verrucomicrobiota bacterium]|nr:MAG: hypothetical protein Ct9H300mP32_2570 [Verrucomicrobiota bacterium]